MAYCLICGTDHGPDDPCSGLLEEKLDDMEIESDPKMLREEFRVLQKKVDRYSLKVLLIIMAGFILLLAVVFVIQWYVCI
jgi:cell division protein FtsL